MNLRRIANSVTTAVNPNVSVTLLKSNGYTIGPGLTQIPSYADPIVGPAQIQALDGDDLKHLDGLNLQGSIRAIYMYGLLAGVLRPDETGGDIIQIDGRNWLVTKVLETWPNWTKAVIVLQD